MLFEIILIGLLAFTLVISNTKYKKTKYQSANIIRFAMIFILIGEILYFISWLYSPTIFYSLGNLLRGLGIILLGYGVYYLAEEHI